MGANPLVGSALGRRAAAQGPSPDEVALVEGGRRLGFEFVRRRCAGTKATHPCPAHEVGADLRGLRSYVASALPRPAVSMRGGGIPCARSL